MNKITFTNKCSVPAWMPDNKKKFRKDAHEYFKNALAQVPLFEGQDIEVTYFLQGVGSIVAKIVSSTGDVYVMKTTETINHTNGEISTYKALTDAGVKVPTLFYDGVHDALPFLIIEYVQGETLADKLKNKELTIKEVAEIRADLFCQVKKVEGRGYGWPIKYENGLVHGNFQDINEFVDTWFCKKEFLEIAQKHSPFFLWEKNLEHHSSKIKEENKNNISDLGSFDFNNGHVFATTPPTMFDICARLEPQYFDLAQEILPFPFTDGDSLLLKKNTFSKYQKDFGPIDHNKLFSALWLQTYRKATNQLLQTDERRTKNGLHMLKILSDEHSLREYMEKYLI
jgi:hypothetical protein